MAAVALGDLVPAEGFRPILTQAHATLSAMTDTYRIRSPETWSAAQADYLAGATAEEACRRHDVGVSAFKKRAREEGWRRADQDDPEVDDEDLELFGALGLTDLVATAWSRLAQAVVLGRNTEAARWMRIHAALHARAQAEADARDSDLRLADVRARFPAGDQRRSPPTRLSPRGQNVHDVHSEFSSPELETADAAPANRADRRRLAREARQRS